MIVYQGRVFSVEVEKARFPNGRELEICQRSLEIDASNEGQATELAKRKFCEKEALCDWSLHADRIQIKQADFPA